jgi:hypothetical protein
LTEFFSPIKFARQESNRAHGFLVARFTPRIMRESNFGRVLVSLNAFKIYTSASQTMLADFNNTTDEFGAGFTTGRSGRVHCKKKRKSQSLQR